VLKKIYRQRTGVWALNIKKKPSVSDCIAELSLRMSNRTADIAQIEGVEDYYVDIFYAVSLKLAGNSSYSFDLTEKDIELLRDLKVPVRFTVDFVPEDDTDA
jgi:hypothetical protein